MKVVHFVFLLVAALVLFTSPIFAQKISPTPPTALTKIEYSLPYPGILPDNSLYRLKLIRDRILDFLIVDPARKAEFYILQADKRLGMGIALVDKGNAALAETTISKGEKYFSQATDSLLSLKSAGKEIPGYMVDRLTKSARKHEEVLKELISRVTGKEQEGLKASLNLLHTMVAQIEKLK